jgi:predicted O-methyltransferase YrrM
MPAKTPTPIAERSPLTSAGASELAPSIFQRYLDRYADTPGWFWKDAIAVWDSLLCFQKKAGITGNFLEIGVWKGKSAILSAMHAATEESCVLVDPLPLVEAKAAIGEFKPENVLYLEIKSTELLQTNIMGGDGRSFRWVHIDGEHSAAAVLEDLKIATTLLSERGVIVVDDFLSPLYPQVSRAVFHHLESCPLQLTLFLCGFNKAYICRTRCASEYLSFCKESLFEEMKARGSKLTVYKTTDPADMNCFGVSARIEDFDLRGPDWDQHSIRI